MRETGWLAGEASAQWYRTRMAFTTLISSATLNMHLGDADWVVIDCRFKLDDVTWGEREYAAAHIPQAVYADLDHDLSAAKTGTNGRHPLPDTVALASTFARLGITTGAQVVAYDQDTGMYASRLWWMLRYMGHDAVAVLDGGFAKWIAEGRETRNGVESRPAATFSGTPRREMIVDAAVVASLIGSPSASTRLIDARAPQRFRGESEPLDKVAGHIPGASNYFFQQNLDANGTFRTPEQLRAQLGGVLGDAPPHDVVCYCGSGVTACHNLLAMEHAGLKGAKLYAGSWSEWCSDEHRPVERG
jgi:thiosulfate/3-mercaptopyruvate sulfurtransferase